MVSSEKIDEVDFPEITSDLTDVNRNLPDSHAICLENKQTIEAEINDYNNYIRSLKKIGQLLRADQDQPNLLRKPPWFNEDLFKNAGSVYERHLMGINFAHLSGLLLLVRVDSIYKTLSATGNSDTVAKLFKRYYHTVRHVKTWYEGNIFEEHSAAYRSMLVVRGMHNKVSSKLNDCCTNQETGCYGDRSRTTDETAEFIKTTNLGINDSKIHISEYDIMITQFAFIGFIITKPKNMGLLDDFSQRDLDSLIHFWRVIGFYLGASDKFNLCSYELKDIVGLCGEITENEYKKSIIKNRFDGPQSIMSINIVRSVKFIPMLTVYGMMRYLYEILGHENLEIEQRRTWYSNLSYTLIKLVMTRLLSYRPLRVFNNGLTRLSLFMVSKVENLFSDYLDSKHGQEMKI